MAKSLTEFQRQFYDQEHAKQQTELASLADLVMSDRITTDSFKEAALDSLKQYYIRLALVAKGGRELIARDRVDIGRFLAFQSGYLDEFADELADYKKVSAQSKVLASSQGVLSRASLYANAWSLYSRYSIPASLADALPALPGIDCLGGALCGCFLIWAVVGDAVEVYWEINPSKENCVLCSDFKVEWDPYTVYFSDLDSDLVEDDESFFYD
jgi:hypothetical protein